MCKRLGVYIGEDRNDGPNVYLRKGDFCYYINNTTNLAYVPTVTVMPLDRPYFKAECLCKSFGGVQEWVIPIEVIQTEQYDIHYECRYSHDVEIYNIEYIIWDHTSDQMPVEILMKSPMLNRKLKLTHTDYILNWLSRCSVPRTKYNQIRIDKEIPKTVVPSTVEFGEMIREEFYKALEKEEQKLELEKSLEKSALKMDPFTIVKMLPHEEKETKTMEKKTMTETDTFLQHINGITITSTYSKLDFGRFGDPYYIYYPETDITEDIADTLLTVLLMAKRDYIHKIVFNPEKGTTAIHCNHDEPVTVRCRDGEFDYILGYNMARTKLYLGSNDYNWFNKIKNHRKTHIEYTEPKAKKTSKKGGKK